MIIVLKETSVFVSPNENSKPAFFSFFFYIPLGTVYENLPFRCPKMLFRCAKAAKTEKKISVFENIRVDVDRA